MKQNDEIIEIDLWKLLLACVQKWWLIAITTILCAVLAFVGTKLLIVPTYESTVKIYVNNSELSLGSISISASDMNASMQLVDVYDVILNTKDTMDVVLEHAKLSGKYDYEDVMKMLNTAAVNNTQVFKVTVTNTDPKEAQLIASTIGTVLPDIIGSIIESADARIVEHAIVPTERSGPSYTRNTVVGAFLGLVLSVLIVVVIELMDTTIKDDKDMLEIIEGIPVLTYIPDFNGGKRHNNYNKNYYRTNSGGDA